MNNPEEAFFVLLVMGLVITFGWILPIVLGLLLFQSKGYSPHWMWFGVHPVGGWIAVLVAACLRKRRRCPDCGGFVESNFWLCPYCGYELVPRGPYPSEQRFALKAPESRPPGPDQGLYTEKRPHPPASGL